MLPDGTALVSRIKNLSYGKLTLFASSACGRPCRSSGCWGGLADDTMPYECRIVVKLLAKLKSWIIRLGLRSHDALLPPDWVYLGGPCSRSHACGGAIHDEHAFCCRGWVCPGGGRTGSDSPQAYAEAERAAWDGHRCQRQHEGRDRGRHHGWRQNRFALEAARAQGARSRQAAED